MYHQIHRATPASLTPTVILFFSFLSMAIIGRQNTSISTITALNLNYNYRSTHTLWLLILIVYAMDYTTYYILRLNGEERHSQNMILVVTLMGEGIAA